MMERKANEFAGSGFMNHRKSTIPEPISAPSLEDEDDDSPVADASKQLVLYDPSANGSGAIEPVQPPQRTRAYSSKVLPSVGAFTVQCANCFKWRLIPSKEQYEEIREHILANPFVCETARAWRPEISCDDPADISQDGSRLWAIDKPNIAQPPPGWQRLLQIRGEGGSKFADVYYQAPSGKRLRSMVEVERFLMEHPEYKRDGATMSRFSFQIPKPLQADYVRKKPKLTYSHDKIASIEPVKVNPLSWADPDDTSLRLGAPAVPPLCIEGPHSDSRNQFIKQAMRPSAMSSRDPNYSL